MSDSADITDCKDKIKFLLLRHARKRNLPKYEAQRLWRRAEDDGLVETLETIRSAYNRNRFTLEQELWLAKHLDFAFAIAEWRHADAADFIGSIKLHDKSLRAQPFKIYNAKAKDKVPRLLAMSVSGHQTSDEAPVSLAATFEFGELVEDDPRCSISWGELYLQPSSEEILAENRLGLEEKYINDRGIELTSRGGANSPFWRISKNGNPILEYVRIDDQALCEVSNISAGDHLAFSFHVFVKGLKF
ncbi:MAG: hypothetical protein AAGB04_18430, partial [Pseudomonadota bacterium]